MSYLRNKFIPWFFSVINIVMVTLGTSISSVLATSIVTDQQGINLKSDWNIEVTAKVLAVNWLIHFSLAFVAYLQKSPLPLPDAEEPIAKP